MQKATQHTEVPRNGLPSADYALRSSHARAALVIGAYAVYALAYIPLRRPLGMAAGLLAFLPVALVGWLFGMRSGLLGGLIVMPLHTLLVNLAGYPGWDVILRETKGLGPLAAIVIGVVAGYWSDLIQVLQQQIVVRKQAEEKFRKSEERYQNFISQSFEAVYRLEFDQPIDVTQPIEMQIEKIYMNAYVAEYNQALTAMYHLSSPEAFIGAHLSDIPGGIGIPINQATIRRLIENDYKSVNEEIVAYDASGKLVGFLSNIIGIVENGYLVRIWGTSIDITERKHTEAAFEESEQRFSILSAAAFEGIVISDMGQIIDVNEQLAAMLRYDRSEMIGHTVDEFVAPESLELVRQHIQSGSENSYEHLSLRKDGSTFPVEIRAKSLPYKGRIVRVTAIRDITVRKRAEIELLRRADEFAALYETAGDLALQHDLPTVLRTIVDRARALLNAPGGGIYLYVAALGELEMVLDVSMLIPTSTRLQLGEGMAGRVAQTRQPLIVNDYHIWEGRSPKYENIPFRAVLQVPMLYSGELIGVLVVYELGNSERHFTEADAHLLSLFSEYAASAVHSTRLLQTMQRRAEETSALLETSLALTNLDLESTLQTIGHRAKTLFASDGCRIFLTEPGGETLRCALALQDNPNALLDLKIKIGEGVTGAVAASGKAEIVNDMLHDPRAVEVPGTPEEPEAIMFAPLKEQYRTIGVLSIRRSGIQRPFDSADLTLLEAFASMASSAVSTARLVEETQRRLHRLSTLRQIDLVITSNLDLHVTLDILLGHILQQLEVDAAAVLLYKPELQCLKFIAGQGFKTQALQFTNLRLGQGFAGKAALERSVVQVFDLNQLHTGFLRSPDFYEEGFAAYIGTPMIAKGNMVGVLEIYHRQPLDFDREWFEYLSTLVGQTAIAIDNIQLFNDLQSANMLLQQAYDATIEGWARALEMRDLETKGHSQRTVDLTLELARRMGIEESQLVHVRRGALLHDIGKMGIPDAILQKPGKLTAEEWEIMKQHPVYAFKWLAPISYLQPAMDIPYYHHEKWDGTGYPRGLKGDEIPLAARIFAVIDVWDALRSERPYQSGLSEEETIAYIREQSGKHFDPQVVETFLRIVNA